MSPAPAIPTNLWRFKKFKDLVRCDPEKVRKIIDVTLNRFKSTWQGTKLNVRGWISLMDHNGVPCLLFQANITWKEWDFLLCGMEGNKLLPFYFYLLSHFQGNMCNVTLPFARDRPRVKRSLFELILGSGSDVLARDTSNPQNLSLSLLWKVNGL